VRGAQDKLADMLSTLENAVNFLSLCEREHATDDRLDHARPRELEYKLLVATSRRATADQS
jgi:hypothetical protein